MKKGRIMRSKLVWVIVPGLVAMLGLALSSCGSSSSSSTSASQAKYAPLTAPPDNAQKGGTLTVLASGDVDHIDPGAAYYQFTYMISQATQRALVGWPPPDTAKPAPDLAQSETISSDGKTITFKLRSGVKFS